jgi:prevent-host-death family protein
VADVATEYGDRDTGDVMLELPCGSSTLMPYFVQNLQNQDPFMRTWPLQEARGHLRDVIDSALDQGPQRITRHGKQAVIVVSEAEWNRRTGAARPFGDLLAESPLTSDVRPPRRPAAAIRRELFD